MSRPLPRPVVSTRRTSHLVQTSGSRERCASYWSADSSVSTASRRLRSLRSESEIEDDEHNGDTFASSASTPSSKFAYSPFASAASPSPRLSDAFSTESFGLGLSIRDDNGNEEDEVASQVVIDNENDAWARQSAWSFRCLESPSLSYEGERRNGDIFGFQPAPSYSYALKHTTFSLLPSAHIPSKPFSPSSSSPSLIPALSSSSLLPSSDDLLQSSKDENATCSDPFNAKYHATLFEGERKRKRKDSSIVGSPSKSQARAESDHVKRLKSSPALKHLGIFTHAALLEEREQAEKQMQFADVLSGLSVGKTGQDQTSAPRLSPRRLPILLEPTPELGSPSPSPSKRTVDCTLLVSSIPSESPYPPTPSSSAFAPFAYTSTIDSLASPSSTTFQEAVKRDICKKLSLTNMGLTVDDVNVFPASSASPSIPRSSQGPDSPQKSPRCQAGTPDRQGLVVVVHTT
ncbi:hypothetical protein P389DRAFT_36973 [Cystobasidium minutum MCA 4210]|uniref:uncharacterized protein n=1 Tax=Cystobasidium minutum MCA 4210 TaxID=1397322 RepID=UPI0034CE380D|eukprot:jgi/Rhomi1/36973/CE36972_1072